MATKELYPENQLTGDEAEAVKAALESQAMPDLIEAFPFLLRASGLYRWNSLFPLSLAAPSSATAQTTEQAAEGTNALFPISFTREELRLDVDGNYPQLTASGAIYRSFALRVHWVAKLTSAGPNSWVGSIWYKDGSVAALPHTNVKITVIRNLIPSLRKATVTFTGGGAAPRTRAFHFASVYFHPAEFEYDHEAGITPDLQINTHAHPNHPASLINETLPIETVYRRAGFDARRSAPGTVTSIPTDGADPNTTWSDSEMHDAMQTYWSRFANKPQWALWVLFAKQHDMGSSLGGIMFDDIGPNHRQGTAIFYDSFISQAPVGDPAPAAYVTRMHFWTAVHEMGHAFNLAHSWQKQLGTPWIPLAGDPEARSYMNYPYFVAGGQTAFFSNFEYRFTDQELLFMRHAPERFVEQGFADWFDHHGFEGASVPGETGFELEVGIDREKPVYDFLEPIVLELKLTNVSDGPKLVPSEILSDTSRLTVVLKKDGKRARQWAPYATHCRKPEATVLNKNGELTESLFVSAGVNGWDLAEPGSYTVQVAMEIEGVDLVSNPLRLRVSPPRSHAEEHVAQDVFSDDAGRVMAFDGSMALESGMAAWENLVDQLPDSKAAIHARITLAAPKTRDYRTLRIDAPEEALAIGGKGAFKFVKAKPDEARKHIDAALVKDAKTAASTLGRVDYKYYCENLGDSLEKKGAEKDAKRLADSLKAISKEALHYPLPRRRPRAA
jgi:hypothetical protein